MHREATRRITIILTIGLTLSCLFFLGGNSCRAFLTETHAGHFCSAEQASAPFPIQTPDDTHMAAHHGKDSLMASIATPTLLLLMLVILFSDVTSRAYARRMDETLVRHGPYKKMFLPYLMATHGF